MRIIRIHDGYNWLWESNGENVRVIRGRKVEREIEDYAEKLVEAIQNS